MPRITIQLVTWNSRSFLPECLESIRAQTFMDFDVTIIDNASVDGTIEYLDQYKAANFRILRNTRNFGFARAHNMGFQLTHSPFVMVLNPDVILTPTFTQQVMAVVENKPQCASISGKLLHYDLSAGEVREIEYSNIIDSTGLLPLKTRRFINRGEGEEDHGQYDLAGPVFGHSGSLVLYRRAALLDVAQERDIYDPDFFAYYEDVDLAWRLQWRGWTSWYQPDALAYHRRAIRASDSRRGLLQAHRSRKLMINSLSYKNHFLLLIKNQDIFSALLAGHRMIIREISMTLGYLLASPSVLSVLPKLFKQVPRAFRHRSVIIKTRRVSAKKMRTWFI